MFYTIDATFKNIYCHGGAPRRRRPRKAVKKFEKISEKLLSFQKGFFHGKKVGFNLKSWGPLKNVITKSGSYSGLGLYIYSYIYIHTYTLRMG